ncbi:MAG TPA: septum formation initiator family protein [Rectinemataceae bacterium]|nr:septum formation initiator family protein [Rectinemataceae bacterium]
MAYCLLSLLAGPAGLLAYGSLQGQQARIARNLDALGALNARLRSDVDSLRSDADRAAREARSLGYLRPGETEVVLSGMDSHEPPPETGSVINLPPSAGLPDRLLKEIAAGIGLTAFAAGLFGRRKRNA